MSAQDILEEMEQRAIAATIAAEQERCAGIAADACLEQDEAGHSQNRDTWLAACAWIRMRIVGEEPKLGISPADLIRESERERCLKHAEHANPLPLHDWASELAGFDRAKKQIADKIRSGQ